MKKLLCITAVISLLLFTAGCTLEDITDRSYGGAIAEKPVIYLYPQEETEVSVKLELKGELVCTYPEYGDGWSVTASPDGTLKTEAGEVYSYLFWEGDIIADYPMDEGYVIKGGDTAEFLQTVLAEMGLLPAEYNDFITYWLPRMQGNAYNLITFQQEAYTDAAVLDIDPLPDSMLRVFMVYKALEEPIAVIEPSIEPFERIGFTVIEWGGTEIE